MDARLKLQEWWKRTGAGIVTKEVDERRIIELELRYQLVLPNDFRQFLRHSSPVGVAMDNHTVTWWNLQRIRNIPDEYAHELAPIIAEQAKKYLFFAD